MKFNAVLPTGLMVLTGFATAAFADAQADMVASAESAAPAAFATGATIYGFDAGGKMMTVREGSNQYWCMADDPATPTADPMCGDANSMEWVMAWINKTEVPPGSVGLIFMLAGGSDASNTDPYGKQPAEGADWVKTGPHVMVVGSDSLNKIYAGGDKPDASKPYVMFGGTPYAHLMIPIK